MIAQADVYSYEAGETLPLGALLALAMTGFTAILTETLPAGLLPPIADGLHVPLSLAGQLVTAYAVGSLVAAIPLISLTQAWRRKPLLLAAIVGFLIFNTATAVSSEFHVALAMRFFAGVAAGLACGLLAGYARRLVGDRLKGRALAIAMVGTPIALSSGVPAGTLLGGPETGTGSHALVGSVTLKRCSSRFGAVTAAIPPRGPGRLRV